MPEPIANGRLSLVRLAAAALVVLGLTLGGWFVGAGFVESPLGPRVVTMKGSAERAELVVNRATEVRLMDQQI